MKNYQFVFGLLLSSALCHGTHAALPIPAADSSRAGLPPTNGGAENFPSGVSTKLPLNSATRSRTSTQDIALNSPMSYVNLSDAFYYLESRAVGVEGARSNSRLQAHKPVASDVSEPASEILMLAALSALAIAIRRQSPS